MLINLWYVAEWSDKVGVDPVRVKMLGQQLVLFRDEAGKVHCLADTCLHRGGSLSKGWVTQGNVTCPYHGWQYNGDGRCVVIPSEMEEGTKIPDKARVDSYPTEERYGMIWVFMGDLPEDERYPIPPFPEFGDPNWRDVRSEWVWQADSARVLENGIDIAHASWVHPMFGHNHTAQRNKIIKLERHDGWATSTNEMYPPALKGGLRRFIRKDQAKTHVHPTFYMAGNTIRMHIEANAKMHIIMFDANTPVDEHTTKTFAIQVRNFFRSKLFDKGSLKRLEKVLREDTAIVEETRPFYLAENLHGEVSVKSDRFMSTYRKMRRDLIEQRGWQIDTDAVEQYRGKRIFAVPSISRQKSREEGVELLLEEIPLKPPVRPADPAVEAGPN
ncbi:Methylxanthine N1-demethylase NdmA [Halioglobus japonicus]|nr:Methylxanthine N1-demethylase NdmA [Halioglobus japonicus]